MVKPTTKQKLAFSELLKLLQEGSPFDLKSIMLKAGYTEATAINPGENLTNKTGWQQLLAKIDDKPLLDRLREIATSEDKRASISAIQELLKLKDRYPAGKLKINAFEERDKVIDDDKPRSPIETA